VRKISLPSRPRCIAGFSSDRLVAREAEDMKAFSCIGE
jgi:hypothetical protein